MAAQPSSGFTPLMTNYNSEKPPPRQRSFTCCYPQTRTPSLDSASVTITHRIKITSTVVETLVSTKSETTSPVVETASREGSVTTITTPSSQFYPISPGSINTTPGTNRSDCLVTSSNGCHHYPSSEGRSLALPSTFSTRAITSWRDLQTSAAGRENRTSGAYPSRKYSPAVSKSETSQHSDVDERRDAINVLEKLKKLTSAGLRAYKHSTLTRVKSVKAIVQKVDDLIAAFDTTLGRHGGTET